MRNPSFPLLAALLLLTPPGLRGQRYVADFRAELATWQAAVAQQPMTRLQLDDHGALVIENTLDNGNLVPVFAPVPSGLKGPWEMTARIKLLKGPPERYAVLLWSFAPNHTHYFSVEEAGGKYSLFTWREGWTYHRPYTATPTVRRDETNELTLRLVGQRVFYLINGKIVDVIDAPQTTLAAAGVWVPAQTTFQLDGFSLQPLGADVAAQAPAWEAEAKTAQDAAGVILNLDKPAPYPLVEEFNDNATGWPLKLETADFAIRDGKLHFENLLAEANKVLWTTKPLAELPKGDHEIVLTVPSIEGPEAAEAGLVFDLNNTSRRVFQITSKHVRYYAYDNGTFGADALFTESPAVKAGGPNELVVRVLGGRAYLLLNGTAVAAFDYQPRGEWLGPIVASGTLATFDRLTVRPLQLTPAARAAEIAKYELTARATRIAAGGPLADWVEPFNDNAQQRWPAEGAFRPATAQPSNSVMAWTNSATTGRVFTSGVPINQAADYRVTLRLASCTGADRFGTGVVWGGDGRQWYGFLMTTGGQWHVYRKQADKFETIVPWRRTSAFKPGQPVELAVQRAGGSIFFLVNGQVLGDLPAPTAFGSQAGIELGAGVTAEFDELKVSYASAKPEDSGPLHARLSAELAAAEKRPELAALSHVAYQKQLAAEEYERLHPPQPTQKDWAEADKQRKKYQNRKMLSLLADRPRPARHVQGAGAHRIYYFYRTIGRADWYLEYVCINTDTGAGNKLDRFVIIDVGLTSTIME